MRQVFRKPPARRGAVRSVTAASELPLPQIRSVRLRDGRRLGYAQYGDPRGRPVFAFHGLPGSRLQRHPDERIPLELGARIITVERPGFGLSDFSEKREIADFADNVEQLADQLGILRFYVAGISGGGPYAAACACRLGQRVIRTAVISGVGPPGSMSDSHSMAWTVRVGFKLAVHAPLLLHPPIAVIARLAVGAPERYLDAVASHLNRTDEEILSRPDVRAMFTQDLKEAFRQGPRGFICDLSLAACPWGFDLASIRGEVRLWHGEDDWLVPPAASRAMERDIPHAAACYFPGEGHFMVMDRWREILAALLA